MSIENIIGLVKLIHDNRLDNDPVNLSLLHAIALGDSNKIATLQRRIQPKILRKQLTGSPFKEPDESVDGSIRFALTETGMPVGFNPEKEPHYLIGGSTGVGKTRILLLTHTEAILRGHTSWLFVKSREARQLLRIKRDTIVINFDGSLKIGSLLKHPFLSKDAWINRWLDIFVQAFGTYEGTKYFLVGHLNSLLERNSNSTIADLYRWIKSLKYPAISRFARYQESALDRLVIVNSEFGKTLDSSDVELGTLIKNNVHIIWEIQNLTAEEQVFIVNLLINWLFHYKVNSEGMGMHFIGVDDANLIFDASFERRPDRGLPEISHIMSMARHARFYIKVCSQIPHQLGASIHSNAFTKIMLSLGNGKDIDCMIQSMGIKDKEQQLYCHRLKEREAIVKFSGRYTEPFLARIPEIRIKKERISDEEIRRNNKRILSQFRENKRQYRQDNESRAIALPYFFEQKSDIEVKVSEKEMLMDIYARPFVRVTQRYKDLNLSAGKGTRVVKALVRKQLVKVLEINLGGRGGSTKFLELQQEAYKILNMPTKKYGRGTGFEHYFWQYKIKEYLTTLNKDLKIDIEKNIKGKFIDIGIEIQDKVIAIEVALSSVNEKNNIKKDIEVGCDFVIVGCKDKKVMEEVNQILETLTQEERKKVCIYLLPYLLKIKTLIKLI